MEKKVVFIRLQCFNPLKKENHTVRDKKTLRNVTSWMCSLYTEIPKEAKICNKCRKEITALKTNLNANQLGPSAKPCLALNDEMSSSDSDRDPKFSMSNIIVDQMNTSLLELEESPIDKRKIQSKQYAKTKARKIHSAMKRKLFVAADPSSSSQEDDLDQSVLQNLKDQFSVSNNRVKKLMILTCLPEGWGIRKIMREFNAPNYMVRQAKKNFKRERYIRDSQSQAW